MAKKKQTGLPASRLLIAGVIVVLVVGVVFVQTSKKSPVLPPSTLEAGSYQLYQDPGYRFTIEYPDNWQIKSDTQVFENGDAVAFRKTGPTQKPNTELTDGAQLAVSVPFTIDSDIVTWARDYFSNQAKFSQLHLSNYTFETVEDCAGLGCMRYYFTPVNHQIVGIAIFVDGTDKEKAVYENTLLYMLGSLQLTVQKLPRLSKFPKLKRLLR